jgi:hypothetical protein
MEPLAWLPGITDISNGIAVALHQRQQTGIMKREGVALLLMSTRLMASTGEERHRKK